MICYRPANKSVWIVLAILFGVFFLIVISGIFDHQRADTAFALGNFNDAARAYSQSAWKNPWRTQSTEQAAYSWYQAGEYELAASTFAAGLHKDSLTPGGWILYGDSYFMLSNAKKALDIWTAGLERYPSYLEFHWNLSKAHRWLQDFTAEEQALKHWVGSEQADAQAYFRLAELIAGSDPEHALAALRSSVNLDPSFSSPADTLSTAIQLASTESVTSVRSVVIGRGLGLLNEWQLAEIQFDRAVQADPHDAEAWAWLGESKSQLGEDSRIELDRALKLNPSSAVVRGLRGLAWKREARYSQALAEFLLAAGLEPENPVWQSSLGEIYYLRGDLDSALTSYQRAVILAPHTVQYQLLLAIFCAETGIRVEDIGLPAALKALELAPGDAQVLDALGWNYLASGRYALAENTLLQAVAGENPATTNLTPRLHLAMTYLAQGNRNAAYGQLVLVRDSQPGSSPSELAARLLEQYYP